MMEKESLYCLHAAYLSPVSACVYTIGRFARNYVGLVGRTAHDLTGLLIFKSYNSGVASRKKFRLNFEVAEILFRIYNINKI